LGRGCRELRRYRGGGVIPMSRRSPFALLETALDAVAPQRLTELHGTRLFITGATGFFGRWVLEGIAQLRLRGIDIGVQCVSRQPPGGAGAPWVTWLRADAAQFADVDIDPATTHILHMAASSDGRVYSSDPLSAAGVILDGVCGVIALAQRTGAHVHLVSSGAVYGARRYSRGPAREDQMANSAPEPLTSGNAYANAKRMAEALLACAGGDNFCISRPFAFLGPLLPLDLHFAAGNFVRDAVAGRPIKVAGDGSPIRSYMHPADLAAWLLALLAEPLRGQAVNIGSAEPVSIATLAAEIAEVAGSPEPEIHGHRVLNEPLADPSAYWPDVQRALQLGLCESIGLRNAIADMLQWADVLHQQSFTELS
jgi:nucleoside-diphosphate-sugar epimerase